MRYVQVIVFLVFIGLSQGSDIWVSPLPSQIPCNSNSTSCGITMNCPCVGIDTALAMGYTLYQTGNTNVTIMALPGIYNGAYLKVNYTVSIVYVFYVEE